MDNFEPLSLHILLLAPLLTFPGLQLNVCYTFSTHSHCIPIAFPRYYSHGLFSPAFFFLSSMLHLGLCMCVYIYLMYELAVDHVSWVSTYHAAGTGLRVRSLELQLLCVHAVWPWRDSCLLWALVSPCEVWKSYHPPCWTCKRVGPFPVTSVPLLPAGPHLTSCAHQAVTARTTRYWKVVGLLSTLPTCSAPTTQSVILPGPPTCSLSPERGSLCASYLSSEVLSSGKF